MIAAEELLFIQEVLPRVHIREDNSNNYYILSKMTVSSSEVKSYLLVMLKPVCAIAICNYKLLPLT